MKQDIRCGSYEFSTFPHTHTQLESGRWHLPKDVRQCWKVGKFSKNSTAGKAHRLKSHHTPHFSQRPPPSQPKCLSYQYLHVFVVDLQIVLANLLLFCKLLTGIPGNGIQPTSPLSPGKHPPTHTHAPHAQIHRYTSVVNTCVQ